MADNVTVDNGDLTDFTVSADETPSGQVQRFKLAYSADGSDTLVLVDANGVKVQGTVAISGSVAAVLSAGTAAIGKLAANSGVDIGDVDVTSLPSLPAGTNAIGKLAANSGIDIGDVDVTSVIPGTAATNLGKAVDNPVGATDTGVAALFVREDTLSGITPAVGDYARGKVDVNGALYVMQAGALDASIDSVALDARAGTGCSFYHNLDLDNAKVQVKGSAGTVHGFYITNRTSSPIYVKMWDSLSASVTVGTTAASLVFEIPGNASNHIGAAILGAVGIKFATGITIACTTGVLTSDNTDPGANACVINLFYK